MGKAQSKRSVDITTETKKVVDDEITEKMEKIEDVDKKEVINGDATISEKSDQEKKDTEEIENDKDMTTEKDSDAQAVSAETQNAAETSKEEGDGLANTEEISPLADESIKKSKKEKVKKKWSFRSISFGKKDKQKPAKTEDATEDGSEVTNGADTDEKTITDPEDNQKDKTSNEKVENTTESHENGNATPQELKDEDQNEEKESEEKSNVITANTTNNTTTTTTEMCESVQNETAVVSSEISEKTENMVIVTSITNENKISEDATANDATKNGNGVDEKTIATEQTLQKEVTNATVEEPSEKTNTIDNDVTNESFSTNGEVIDKIHQNGDHAESEEIVEKSKEQNEVNFNTDNKVSAATLDYNSSTSINPSNIQIHVQDFNASSEKPDEIIHINNNESNIETSTDIEVKMHTDVQPSISESVSMTQDFGNNVEIETIENIASDNSDNEKSTEEKVGVEPSPPPLPISPPPSQVSVFAFTNNETVEDSSKIFERTLGNVINDKEDEVSSFSKPVCEHSNTEILINKEQPNEEIVSDNPAQQMIHVNEINETIITGCDKIQEACKDLSMFEESQNEEESSVAFATAVIDEITEKAAAIVNEQLKCSEEQITDEQFLECNKMTEEENKNDEDVENKSTIVEFDNENLNDNEEVMNEITSISTENPIAIKQSNNTPTTDCSLDFSTSNLILDDQEQMISLKKGDNLDEEHLNPTKESANTKDIKDNVAAAEITQDLSVTCE